MNDHISVSSLIQYIKRYFDNDKNLINVSVNGEISNFFHHKSDHLYFTLKDKNASIKCVMFKSYSSKLTKEPKDGDKVIVRGHVSIFEEAGTMQLYVEDMKEDGEGDLYRKYEELKNKLEKEGYFKDEHKKALPTKYPERVAVLVGDKSAAMSDIKITFALRWPLCKVDYYPVPVQGNEAYKDIIKTLKEVDNKDYEIIVLSRGGGSFEDYAPFNNEELVKCIYDLKTFIVSGIGHERDFSLADFVSDLRGATPTAAIEHITPKIEDVINEIDNYRNKINKEINNKMDEYNEELNDYLNNKYMKNPLLLIERPTLLFNYYFEKILNYNKRIIKLNNENDTYVLKMNNALHKKINNINDLINNNLKANNLNIKHLLDNKKLLLKRYQTLIQAYSSENVLNRGYSLVYKKDKLIKTIKDLKENDQIEIKLIDGNIDANVKGVR